MIDPDVAKVSLAGGLILGTSVIALRTGHVRRPREHAARVSPATAPVVTPSAAAGSLTRLRILTGEPAAPEPRRPAPRRAMKLVLGMAVLAVAGAFGLLAFVRALISMFDRIGG